jgi:hypothetical protein
LRVFDSPPIKRIFAQIDDVDRDIGLAEAQLARLNQYIATAVTPNVRAGVVAGMRVEEYLLRELNAERRRLTNTNGADVCLRHFTGSQFWDQYVSAIG